jgi:hypothetical protein
MILILNKIVLRKKKKWGIPDMTRRRKEDDNLKSNNIK